MSRLVIAAVGRVRERGFREVLDDYYGRVRRYCPLDEIELKEEREDKLVDAFSRTISSVGARAVPTVLDVRGRAYTSDTFAQTLGERLDRAEIPVFLLGGAEGLPASVRERARWTISLSTMTLPHRLARVILAEQIYRAFTILRGEPYAREGVRG